MEHSNLLVSTSTDLSHCYHHLEIKVINEAHELTRQLRAVLLPSLPAGSLADLAREILDKIIKSCSLAAFMLQSGGHGHQTSKQHGEGERPMLDGHKKRKSQNASSIVTSVPYEDGHQWTKYGQKRINGAKYPRSYHRCIYHKDQDCPATKTVQRVDRDADPPEFIVVYNMQHRCRSSDRHIPFVMESAEASLVKNQSRTDTPSDGDPQMTHLLLSDEISNISLTPEQWNLDNDLDPVMSLFEFADADPFYSSVLMNLR
ncbi:unnamed protein product [Musa acuminata subsp. malaccensis]|uniref:(wild Malaysian banana) hypothetical protein n=1 Tax=Musa acuminata subsp. malaccensis TaxID=214687 RepID=A0A804JKV4_MUSAM|nr:PREDICTED: probable WRKY transcription factor 70 [Musa acuminata subsp. malaccensis]CAG1847512.1 unnamed protein product [Musa acuminata subsp. malaccensis]